MDVNDLEKRHREDFSDHKLLDLVEVTLSPDIPMDLRSTKHFQLSGAVLDMAMEIHTLRDSHVFRRFWKETASMLSELRIEYQEQDEDEDQEQDEDEDQDDDSGGDKHEDGGAPRGLTLWEACDSLYKPCRTKFKMLYQNLRSAEVTFGEINATLQDFTDKYKDLTAELKVMCTLNPSDSRDWIPNRVEQIKEYQHLNQAVDSAKVILEVKDNLGLTGDFSVLQTLLSFVSDPCSLLTCLYTWHSGTCHAPQFAQASRCLSQDLGKIRDFSLKSQIRARGQLSWPPPPIP